MQPALFVAGLAAVEKLREENPAALEGCSATAGLSLGEYTALVFAGAMTFKDGLKVRSFIHFVLRSAMGQKSPWFMHGKLKSVDKFIICATSIIPHKITC